MDMREKRIALAKSHIFPSMKEQLELFREQESMGKIISMSDYLFGVIEEHIAFRQAMRITRQKLGRRVGNQ
jgi:hypothetical protein